MTKPPRAKARTPLRTRLALLFFGAFLVSVYAWTSASRIPWETGSVRVLLWAVVPSGGVHPADVDVLREGPLGLDRAERWFADEYLRYRPTGRPLQVAFELRGVDAIGVPPFEPTRSSLGPAAAGVQALRLYLAYRRLALVHGIEFEAYDAAMVLLFEPHDGDVEAHSFADGRHRFGVVRLPVELGDPGYAALTIVHEMGHTFGAFDKYDPVSFRAVWPEGYVQPTREPLYPQPGAEIMAVDIPTGPDAEREPVGFFQIAVGPRTAAEFGWIPPKIAAAAYAGDGTPDE